MNKSKSTSFLAALAREQDQMPECANGYFSCWTDNVFRKMDKRHLEMFNRGSGNELNAKARARHSSSMLAYNFFHWVSEKTPLKLSGKEFVDVAFEVKLPCLRNRSAKANIDVALVEKNGEAVLFLESKFTEHFHSRQFAMREAYYNPDNYAVHGKQWKDLICKCKGKDGRHYHEGIKQAICHLIAIDRLRNNQQGCGKLDSFRVSLKENCQFCFATVVFEPNGERFEKEHKKFEDYRKLFRQFTEMTNQFFPTSSFFLSPVSSTSPNGFLTYGDIFSTPSESMPSDLRSWLCNRYMQFSAMP